MGDCWKIYLKTWLIDTFVARLKMVSTYFLG